MESKKGTWRRTEMWHCWNIYKVQAGCITGNCPLTVQNAYLITCTKQNTVEILSGPCFSGVEEEKGWWFKAGPSLGTALGEVGWGGCDCKKGFLTTVKGCLLVSGPVKSCEGEKKKLFNHFFMKLRKSSRLLGCATYLKWKGKLKSASRRRKIKGI